MACFIAAEESEMHLCGG